MKGERGGGGQIDPPPSPPKKQGQKVQRHKGYIFFPMTWSLKSVIKSLKHTW